jgi:hypothetical protein
MTRLGYIKRSPLRSKKVEPRRIERIPLTILRPGEMKKEQPAIKVFAGGREVCNQLTKAGRNEYSRRKRLMYDRQGGRCGLVISPQCKQRNGRWPFSEVQFGHEVSRGGGKQDDRIEVDGKPKNRVLCS